MRRLVCGCGKGGVGKTTVAAYLAKCLANDHNVGVLDVDIECANAPIILGMKDMLPMDVDNKGVYPKVFENLKVASILFELPRKDTTITWYGDRRALLVEQIIKDTIWGEIEWLVCDLPPGTSDEVMGIIKYMPKIDGAIIVTTGKEESLIGAEKLIGLFRDSNIPIIGSVENMPYMIVGEDKIPLFEDKDVEKELGIPLLDRIPFYKNLSTDHFQNVKKKVIDFFEGGSS